MVSVNTLCKSVLNVKSTVIDIVIFNATSIPINQPPGKVLTEVGFWLKLSTRNIVSSVLSMVYMLPKCHELILAVDLQKTLILMLHGLHPIFQEIIVKAT